jgi:hypothetical protein
MSQFLSAPDPVQQAAIDALQAAIEAEPDRVFATVMADPLLDDWMRRHDLIAWPLPVGRAPCAGHLQPHHRCDPLGQRGLCSLPGCDHSSLWAHPGDAQPRVFVTQPYSLHLAQLAIMARKCQRAHLSLVIESGTSWHFPGRTMAIVISRQDEPAWA